MNKLLLIYIPLFILFSYVSLTDSIMIYSQAVLGMKVVLFHPMLPLTDEFAGELTLMPQVIRLLCNIIAGIFLFILIIKDIKGDKIETIQK